MQPPGSTESGTPAPDPLLGRRMGAYRLLQRLGEGGMGAVYLAEREGEFRRRVAVKLVRATLATSEVLARFQRERQTLAGLSHPNIVTLLDGWATEASTHYCDLCWELTQSGDYAGAERAIEQAIKHLKPEDATSP